MVSQRKFGNRPSQTVSRRNLVCYAAGGAAVSAFLLSGRGLPALAQEGTPAAQLGGCIP
ncbi:MAG: hypothetical protein K0S99_2110, partial [Thermomicrobiales bacterium]|nr:hypothetical protein [Thermomicrobiales bacterium]